ncbi:hypothetical protein B0186_03660 [Canicola haemoglobinophilus]|nr:hypothetical protein B0186_03660 [Canicola haemoglobinophilus]
MLGFSQAILAQEIQPFEQSKFEQLVNNNEAVLIHIHADWCPVCRKQAKELNTLLKEPRNASLSVFKVDFDGDRKTLNQFNVKHQSTLILFYNGKEIRRATGITNREKLQQFLSF